MSQTMPPLVPVPVDDVPDVEVEVEVELSGDAVLNDESAAEVSDPADTVVISGWLMLPKLDAAPPPPQVVRQPIRARATRARMGSQS